MGFFEVPNIFAASVIRSGSATGGGSPTVKSFSATPLFRHIMSIGISIAVGLARPDLIFLKASLTIAGVSEG